MVRARSTNSTFNWGNLTTVWQMMSKSPWSEVTHVFTFWGIIILTPVLQYLQVCRWSLQAITASLIIMKHIDWLLLHTYFKRQRFAFSVSNPLRLFFHLFSFRFIILVVIFFFFLWASFRSYAHITLIFIICITEICQRVKLYHM